jgi:hypothetical protein
MAPAAQLRPRHAPHLEIRDTPDGVVIYDSARDRLHFLNASATFLFECVDGHTRVDELPALLASAFPAALQPTADAYAYLDILFREGLLTTLDAIPSG